MLSSEKEVTAFLGGCVTNLAHFLQKYNPAYFTPCACAKANQHDLPWNPIIAASHSRIDLLLKTAWFPPLPPAKMHLTLRKV